MRMAENQLEHTFGKLKAHQKLVADITYLPFGQSPFISYTLSAR